MIGFIKFVLDLINLYFHQAAAVSSVCSPMGIGSDIGGSIRMPAFFNGVFGHKPSPYLVSNKGRCKYFSM